MDWAKAVAMERARRARRVKRGFILLGYGSHRWLRRDALLQPKKAATGTKRGGQRWPRPRTQGAATDGCSLYRGAKIGDFLEICKRLGEKMRKIGYFV